MAIVASHSIVSFAKAIPDWYAQQFLLFERIYRDFKA